MQKRLIQTWAAWDRTAADEVRRSQQRQAQWDRQKISRVNQMRLEPRTFPIADAVNDAWEEFARELQITTSELISERQRLFRTGIPRHEVVELILAAYRPC